MQHREQKPCQHYIVLFLVQILHLVLDVFLQQSRGLLFYIYKAKNPIGETKTGTKEAADQNELAKVLHQEQLLLLSAEAAGAMAESVKRKLREVAEELADVFSDIAEIQNAIGQAIIQLAEEIGESTAEYTTDSTSAQWSM